MVRRISIYARLVHTKSAFGLALDSQTGSTLSTNAGSWSEAKWLESVFGVTREFGVAEPSLRNELIWTAEVLLRVRHYNISNRDGRLMGAVLDIDKARWILWRIILTSFGTNVPAR